MPQEEELKNLRQLLQCLAPKIKENPVVYTGCVESVRLISRVLDKLAIRHVIQYGKVKTIPEEKEIWHCWIETENCVIETNPSQVLGIDRAALAFEKHIWEEATEAKADPEYAFFPKEIPLTPAGKHFYDKEAEQVVRCYRGKQ